MTARTVQTLPSEMPSIAEMTYDGVYQIVLSLEDMARRFRPNIVIGIGYGGVIPASMIAQRLSIPVIFLRCRRGDVAPEWMQHGDAKNTRVLLVDDIASSGKTLLTTKRFLESKGNTVCTMTIFYDPHRSSIIPDISVPAENYILFPWERRDLTPVNRGIFQNKGHVSLIEENDYIAVDMDGVIAPDIRKRLYQKRLGIALSMRDKVAPLPFPVSPDKIAIITGRPLCDYDRTRKWLDENGYQDVDVYMRDEARFSHATDDVAAHKATTALEIGASVFYESDLMQSTLIAERSPTLKVVWWGKDKKMRIGGVSRLEV